MSDLETIPGGSPIYKNSPPNILSESPIYRAVDRTLHWIDLLSRPGLLHILQLSENGDPIGSARVVETSLPTTCIRFVAGAPGTYICATRHGIGFLDEETGRVNVVKDLIDEDVREGWTMNDGAVDAQGRFWVGECDLAEINRGYEGKEVRAEGRGRLWRLQRGSGGKWKCDEMDQGIICGNGIGWSPDGKMSEFAGFCF